MEEQNKERVKDGGPAFPGKVSRTLEKADVPGMTLRDWFAGQILSSSTGDDPEAIATDCYRIADAMLAEREK